LSDSLIKNRKENIISLLIVRNYHTIRSPNNAERRSTTNDQLIRRLQRVRDRLLLDTYPKFVVSRRPHIMLHLHRKDLASIAQKSIWTITSQFSCNTEYSTIRLELLYLGYKNFTQQLIHRSHSICVCSSLLRSAVL